MADKDDIISLGVELDVKGAVRAVGRFRKDMDRNMGAVSKKAEAFAKLTKKANKAAVKSTEAVTDAVEDLTDAYEGESKVVKELERRLAHAHGDEKKALEEEISLLREANKHRAAAGKKESGKKKKKFADEEIKSGKELKKIWGDGAKEAAGEFRDGIRAAFSKDLKGAVEGAFKGAGKTLETVISGGFSTAAKGLSKGGSGLKALGEGLSNRGKASGGAGGMAMKAAGGGMKMLGGVMSKMAPLVQTIAKLGPLVSTLSTALVAVVKVFIDAEAQAKGFQKDLLQSASTAEFLAASGGDADMAFNNLQDTLKEVRDAAYDARENLAWGITADEHKAVLGALNQEGISLQQISKRAEIAGKSTGAFAAELVHAGVAYSRAFGVPLQEINSLQAEMMTDLGMSLDDTRMAFAQMTRSAADSGIAANKFFAIIRGVSQDLSLWGTRMGDAVKMLKMLGKVMNPREAAKFMSTAMQGLKNMGRQERLRLNLLAGSGKMAGLVNRDIKRKAGDLAKTLNMTGDELIDRMQKEGPAGLEDAIKKLPDDMQGSVREGLLDMQMQQKRASKGQFGVSSASANMGPAAALEAMQSALAKWGGGKKLSEGVGSIGMEMMAENLGVSQEQLDQMVKYEAAIDNQREVLKKQLKSGDKKQADQARAALKQAGVQGATDEELSKNIDAAGYDQITDTLDETTKKQLTEANKVENFAKKQSDLTQSLLDKLGVLIDFMMNQVYDVLYDIYDGIISIPGVKGPTHEQVAAKKLASRHQNKELYDAAGGGAGAIANTNVVKAFNKALDDMGQADKDSKAAEAQVKDLLAKKAANPSGFSDADAEALSKAKSKATDALNKKEKIAGIGEKVMMSYSPEQIAEAMKMAGLDQSKQDALIEAVKNGKDKNTALKDVAGDQLADVWRKAPWVTGGHGVAASASGFGEASSDLQSAGYYNKDTGKAIDATAETSEAAAVATKKLADEGATPGAESLTVKFGPNFLRSKLRPALEKSMLSALRTALFEYYMYSEMDRSEVAKYMKDTGMSIEDFSQQVGDAAKTGVSGSDLLKGPDVGSVAVAGKNAAGGIVAGVGGGLATVRAAAGEGLASVGPGERIVPAGGGGGGSNSSVNLYVNGIGGNDLGQFLRAKIIDGIAEYKRRERFS